MFQKRENKEIKKKIYFHRLVALGLVIILSNGFNSCSLDRFVIRQSAALLDYGVIALYEETDLILAERALAADIKLLEGMIKGDPENIRLYLLTSQAIAGYALGFAEDESPERARSLYLRARDHGFRALLKSPNIEQKLKEPLSDFVDWLNLISDEDIAPLFWTAFAWAEWINLSLDNPRALIELPKVQAMMQKVIELDETFFYGSAHLFFGSIWGTRPPMLGGNPERAKEHFEKNLTITKGNFLMTHVYYARYYAIRTMNEELFDTLMQHVEKTPSDALPGYQLINVIAKKKAQLLLKDRDKYF
jgi:hypothetical protein